MKSYSLYEQETSITYTRDEDTATIFTSNPKDIRKLDKFFSKRSEDMQLQAGNNLSRIYTVPKKWIKIIPNRILTDEQKEEIRQRFNKIKK